jgi:tRNA1(Val) A37 N6-methylase TrmN6
MSISKATFSKYIKEFKLKELFNELGWDNANAKYPIKANERLYSLTGIAQKRDFLILLCEPHDGGSIPDSAERKKIDNAITKLHYEHLIVYLDGKKTRQHWELVVREQNKPIVCRLIDYYAGQQPELLFQKLEGLFFAYEDEEKLSIVDVRSRVMENFERNAAVVTKKFYERFQKEHQKFLKFIEGIQSKVDHEWFASLMLNRLMFIYFIQKKGFLDKDKDYLRTKLKAVQQKQGKNKFYSFYRNFLLVLFHKGLGSPLRDAELEAEIGKVPYLNGGLFDTHQIEQENKDIAIEDKAFERLFDFFDEYNWHLDTRMTATGKDINPDVIGYIFEKYINDRAAMGAYYTKEDITEYISKNCIVPWLFDEVKRADAKPFGKNGEIWAMLQQSDDKYIYPAVKHGIKPESSAETGFSDLPAEVQAGLDPNTPDLVEKRRCWNRPAPADIALPTEIYRELIARRKRYYEVRQKIEQGEITEINDFITYNLGIRQFAQDVLRETDDADLVRHFYKALKKITVLDPTCGSGAFLFAALNILEPLYYECVKRMREFVEEDGKGKHKFFEDELKLIDSDEHPSTEYFIYKSIILHNLYGVDIMKEAVEIAKLRLFLKLVATVEVDYAKPNLGLEPLPDIDFNIRSGNTLVGYATLGDLDKGGQAGLFGDEEKKAIIEEADVVSRAYTRFKDAQLVMHTNPKLYKDAKDALNSRLSILNEKLHKYLAVTYLGPTPSRKVYDAWLASHQPFHWLAEFYTTIAQGGFDVIIGNPPYVEISDVIEQYTIRGLNLVETGNLYSVCVERFMSLLKDKGRHGVIIPISSVSTPRMLPLMKLMTQAFAPLYLSNFAVRPGKLFIGTDMNLNIVLGEKQKSRIATEIRSTRYNRWQEEYRPYLFENLSYTITFTQNGLSSIPKIGSAEEAGLMQKLAKHASLSRYQLPTSNADTVYYHSGGRYFRKCIREKLSNEYKELVVEKGLGDAVICLLSSSLYYWFWIAISDCYHVTKRDVNVLPVPDSLIKDTSLRQLADLLILDLNKHSKTQIRNRADGSQRNEVNFQVGKSKLIIDQIDRTLAEHYGFAQEELDFIINYDIKYRENGADE